MRTHLLRSVEAALDAEQRNLRVASLDVNGGHRLLRPRLEGRRLDQLLPARARPSVPLEVIGRRLSRPISRPLLFSLRDDLHALDALWRITKLLKVLSTIRVSQRLLPLAVVRVDEGLHLPLHVVADAQLIVEQDLFQVRQAAGEALDPARCALQLLGGADVEDEEAVEDAHDHVLGDVGGEELGVARFGAAVASDEDVEALVCGDEAEVLGLRFGALSNAAGDAAFHFMGGADALVPLLEADGHADAVADAEAAPVGADAALQLWSVYCIHL